MSEPNIPIDQPSVQFFSVVYQQNHIVSHLLRQEGRELVRDTNRDKQWGILIDLMRRKRQHKDQAVMSDFERAAVGQYANWLVQLFHDLQGTPEDKRPHINFVPGGGLQWTAEQAK